MATQPHIFLVEKWTLPTQTIYCFADYHLSTKDANKVRTQQQEALIALAKRLKAVAIVEDARVYHKDLFENPLDFFPSRYITGLEYIRKLPNDSTPLAGLGSLLREENIPRENTDFRVPKNISLNSSDFTPPYPPISAKTTFQVLEKTINTIKTFDDGELCNKFYQSKIESVEQGWLAFKPLFFALFKENNKTLQELLDDSDFTNNAIEAWIASHPDYFCKNQEEAKELRADSQKYVRAYISVFDAELVDCYIVRVLRYYAKAPVIFICAGSGHIHNIRPVLEGLGYKREILAGEQYESHYENLLLGSKEEPDGIKDLTAVFAAETDSQE